MNLFKKLFKLCAAFVLFPLAVFLSLYSLDQQGFFKIDEVEIRVNTLESQKNFVAPHANRLQQKLDSVKGISLWKAPFSQISASLREEAWIRQFQLSRAWPSGIRLVIEPDEVAFLVLGADRSPAASEGGATEMRPVTQSGRVLGKISSDVAPNTLISHDNVFLKNKKIREGAVELIQALPEKGRLSAAQVAEIGYDSKEGYWLRLLQSETKVSLGEEQFAIKTARIAQVINYLESRNLKARVIDANLSKKVLVRLQQNP